MPVVRLKPTGWLPMTRQSSDLLSLYIEFIQWTGDGTGLPDTILHIHAGMAVLLLARLLTRKSLGSLVPLAFVVVAELGNEIMDRLHYGSWRWPDTSMDVLNTLLWPAVLSLAIRLRPPVTRRR
jgi:hypothetical protein